MSGADRGEVVERVRAAVLQVKPEHAGEVPETARFTADLALDSLDLAELVARLEQEFRTRVPDEDFDRLETVGGAVDYIVERLRER